MFRGSGRIAVVLALVALPARADEDDPKIDRPPPRLRLSRPAPFLPSIDDPKIHRLREAAAVRDFRVEERRGDDDKAAVRGLLDDWRRATDDERPALARALVRLPVRFAIPQLYVDAVEGGGDLGEWCTIAVRRMPRGGAARAAFRALLGRCWEALETTATPTALAVRFEQYVVQDAVPREDDALRAWARKDPWAALAVVRGLAWHGQARAASRWMSYYLAHGTDLLGLEEDGVRPAAELAHALLDEGEPAAARAYALQRRTSGILRLVIGSLLLAAGGAGAGLDDEFWTPQELSGPVVFTTVVVMPALVAGLIVTVTGIAPLRDAAAEDRRLRAAPGGLALSF